MQRSMEGHLRGGHSVRVRCALGAFVLFVLAVRARGAEFDPAAFRLTQGAAFRIAASYEESAVLHHTEAASVTELGGFSAKLLVVWTVRTVAQDRIVLDAECLQAYFAVSVPGEQAVEGPRFVREWKHTLPWRGKLEVVLTEAGATLHADTASIVAAIQREELKVPGIPPPQPQGLIPEDLLAARILRAIERMATEIFRDELPGSGAKGGPPVSIAFADKRGRPEGAWEVRFGPRSAIEPGVLWIAPVCAAFVAPGGARTPDPIGFSRTIRVQGASLRSEWNAQLKYPPAPSMPWSWYNMPPAERSLSVSFRSRRFLEGVPERAEDPNRRELESSSFSEGQVFLFVFEAEQDLKSLRANKTCGTWVSLSARAAARVSKAGDRPKFEATFIEGSFVHFEAKGAPLLLLFSGGSHDAIAGLTGIKFSAELRENALEIAIDERSLKAASALRASIAAQGTAPRILRPGELGPLALWIRICMLPAFLELGGQDGGAPREIAALPVQDPGGASPGQLVVEIARRTEEKEEIDGVPRKVVGSEAYSLRSKWVTPLGAGAVAAREEEPVLSVRRDPESPIPRRAKRRADSSERRKRASGPISTRRSREHSASATSPRSVFSPTVSRLWGPASGRSIGMSSAGITFAARRSWSLASSPTPRLRGR